MHLAASSCHLPFIAHISLTAIMSNMICPIRLLIPCAACLLQDAQAGRNVIDCLLRYLDKGGHWTDIASISLRSVAIGIMRKV